MTEAQQERKRNEFRRWYERHRAERLIAMRTYTRRWSLRRRYGLTPEDLNAMPRSANVAAAPCGGRRMNLVTDYDHRLGSGNPEAVRGQLRNRCNCETFRLFERLGLEHFWTLVREYEPLGLTPDKAAHLIIRGRYRGSLNGDFRWGRGTGLLLYGVDLLPDPDHADPILLVEGESDC